MILAIPLDEQGDFAPHYGAAHSLACYDFNDIDRSVRELPRLRPDSGTPCSWPVWLHAQGVQLMLVGSMGALALARFEALGMLVLTGVPTQPPEALLRAYGDQELPRGRNACAGHEHGDPHGTCGHAH